MKQLPAKPASHKGASSWLLHFQGSSLLKLLGKHQRRAKSLSPDTDMGDQDETPNSWLQSSPGPTTVDIW